MSTPAIIAASLGTVLAAGFLAPGGAQAAAADCVVRHYEMRGPANRPCRWSVPLRFRTMHGEPVERVALTVLRPPSHGRVRIQRSAAANRIAAVYTPAGRAPVRDRFVLRMCNRGPGGMQCADLPFRVTLTGRSAAAGAPALARSSLRAGPR